MTHRATIALLTALTAFCVATGLILAYRGEQAKCMVMLVIGVFWSLALTKCLPTVK